MQTKVQEFLNGEVGQITKFLFDKGWTMEQIIDEVQSEDSYQIECMAMYHCQVEENYKVLSIILDGDKR